MMPRMNRQLIQVVAQLKPSRCGVSDHALSLAQELKTTFGIDTTFVVLNSDEKSEVPYPSIHCAPNQLLGTCLSINNNEPGAILVHLSGYGYSRDGAPTQLANALSTIKQDGRFRVAVYFHELCAKSMPWRSAFWHSFRQKRAIGTIASECDLRLTNTQLHANWLERNTTNQSSAPVQLLHVFSTIDASITPGPTRPRLPAMAVFGLISSRRMAYKYLSSQGAYLNALGINEIIDIGPDFDAPHLLHGIPVRSMGQLPATELASLLSTLRFGFVPHPFANLAKSSIFASYCALGVVSVVSKPSSVEIDGLQDGVHLVSPKTVDAANSTGVERCSASALDWYFTHRKHIHAATYASWLLEPYSKQPNQ